MKYWISTYGCQMNKADSERIAAVLESIGYKAASKIEEADLVVVNMCSVRQSAVDRIYGLLPKLQKLKIKNLKLKIILTGCVLEKDRERFSQCFDYIPSIKDLPRWTDSFRTKPSKIHDREIKRVGNYFKIRSKCSNKFTAFVPIMTGCNNFCAYCVVPYTRGREISRPAEEIICEVKNLVKNGYKEIWLLGQNVNSYKHNFPKLLRTINKIPGKFWLRFTSSHPKDFSDDLIKTMANCSKVTEYLNLPVQAGDDNVLKRMNRPYTIKYYKNLIKKVREKIPNISLSTDVIVGFPGETKKHFENTVKLLKEIKYDMAYIAKYSPRPGTQGAKLIDNVSQKEKRRREKVLTEILKKTALENNKKYIGKIIEVLMIDNSIGKTRTNKTLKIITQNSKFKIQNHNLKPKGKNLTGRFVKMEIAGTLPWGLKGKVKRPLD